MPLIDWIKRRKNVSRRENQGLDLATTAIQKYPDRQFIFKAFNKQYVGIDSGRLQELLKQETNSTTLVYRYKTSTLEYTDAKGISQLEILITAKASMMTRYNPLDQSLQIKTQNTPNRNINHYKKRT